jgi:hypothetical protein
MRKHMLRMMAGTVASVLLIVLVAGFSLAPVKLVIALMASILVVIILALVYKLGDFIGYVFFNGNF